MATILEFSTQIYWRHNKIYTYFKFSIKSITTKIVHNVQKYFIIRFDILI